jgi:hypothetical protein
MKVFLMLVRDLTIAALLLYALSLTILYLVLKV